MDRDFIDKIYTITDKSNVRLDEPMSRHTTFRIGGNADILVDVAADELVDIIAACNEDNVPYTILGNGSNVLVGDKGIRGVTIIIGKRMSGITVDGSNAAEEGSIAGDGKLTDDSTDTQIITAEAGALLSKTANIALQHSLAGMEFASGIPGSVGGAVLMNAGAYGGEIKDILIDATIYTPKGGAEVRKNSELDLSYRHSRIMDEGGIILSARFQLKKGTYDDIKSVMTDLNNRRTEKQPLNYPGAGSTFKRPEGYFAGKLIQDAGLMGYRIGGAEVSTKHAGFVINADNATASDVRQLMQDVQDKVYEQNGVRLEPEVRFVGEF